MRKTPLDDKAASTFRVTKQTRRRAELLADLLNGAAKPDGFPVTDVSRSNSPPQPRRVAKAHAMDIALGYVLDLLETGDATATELLKRAATLAETHPAKARAKREVRREKREKSRLAERADAQLEGGD